MGEVVRVIVLETYAYEVRIRRKCTVCERQRMTTKQQWQVGEERRYAYVCNPCLAATPPWPSSTKE